MAEEGLPEQLLRADRSAGSRLVVEHLRVGASPAEVAQSLLAQPQAQLQAHGLLAARLGGLAGPVLETLISGDPRVYKQAAAFVCQVPTFASCTQSCPALRRDY